MGRLFSVCLRAAVGACLAWGLVGASVAQSLSLGPVDGLIVKLKDAPSHERMAALSATTLRTTEANRVQHVLQAARMTEVRTRPAGRAAQHFNFGRQLSESEAQTLAAQLRSQPEVEWVELNSRERLLQAAVVPNDLYYRYVSPTDTGQWWLRLPGETTGPVANYGAPGVQNAWSLETGRSSAIVAVLDTGTTNHSEMSGRYLPGYDFVSEVQYSNDGNGRDTDPSDPGDWVTQADIDANPALFSTCAVQPSSWHGTIVSGIIAAATNNAAGVAGINWNGRVLPVRVAGKCGALVTDIVDGMRWAAGLHVTNVPDNPNPARIINISFGGSAPCGDAYQSTIDELASYGVVVVAAAGNEFGAVTRPASCARVVGVAALARDGLKAGYSNFGPQVVVSTVGGDPDVDDGILTVFNSGTQSPAAESYANAYGTSFSAPIVSGVISLMLSANPNLTVPQIISGLQVTAAPHVQSTNVAACSSSNPHACVCTTSTCGAGVLDAEKAVRYAIGAPPETTPTRNGGGGALSWGWLVGLAMGVLGAACASGSGFGGARRKRLAE